MFPCYISFLSYSHYFLYLIYLYIKYITREKRRARNESPRRSAGNLSSFRAFSRPPGLNLSPLSLSLSLSCSSFFHILFYTISQPFVVPSLPLPCPLSPPFSILEKSCGAETTIQKSSCTSNGIWVVEFPREFGFLPHSRTLFRVDFLFFHMLLCIFSSISSSQSSLIFMLNIILRGVEGVEYIRVIFDW